MNTGDTITALRQMRIQRLVNSSHCRLQWGLIIRMTLLANDEVVFILPLSGR